MSQPLIIELDQISIKDKYLVGGKALNLGKLINFDFNIPKGFALTINAYKLFLEQNNISEMINTLTSQNYNENNLKQDINFDEIAQIHNLILKGHFSSEIKENIKKLYIDLRLKSVAVRSSATIEDLPEASFAGQYESYLNLKNFDNIIYHIKKCYASAWTKRAVSYRLENNIPINEINIAVIIQEMIDAKLAGVLFTQNPISLEKSESLIESNFGLGESIMSGLVNPDQFIINCITKNRRNKFEIIDRRISKKNLSMDVDLEGEGIKSIELDDDIYSKPSCSDKELINLVKIGKKIEAKLNFPQDIEWAIDNNNEIFILQSRPITALHKKKRTGEKTFWTRGYSDDYWNDPVTPLFFDLLGDQLTKIVSNETNEIMGYKKIESQLLKLFNGHVYFNLNVLRNRIVNEIPSFVRDEDILNYFPEGSGPYGKKTMRELPFRIFKRLIAEIRVSLFDPDGSILKTADVYDDWTENEFLPFCDKFDNTLRQISYSKNLKSLYNLARELDKTMIKHFRLVRYGLPVHNIGMNLISRYLLKKFIGEREALSYFPLMISGLEHELKDTNDKLYDLAEIIQNSSELLDLFHKENSEQIYRELSTNSISNEKVAYFMEYFNQFLKRYGDRGFTREPFYPRWGEEPKYVIDILRSLIIEPENSRSSILKNQDKYRKLAEDYVEAKIRSQRFGFLKWKLFSTILKFARRYIIFREAQRFNLDKWITRNRRVYLKIGELFVEKGFIDESRDIFFLRREEIREIIYLYLKEPNRIKIMEKIKNRKEEFKEYENSVPPKFLIGSREYDDVSEFDKKTTKFHGIPASQGLKTGKIRVLNTIEDISNVRPEDILVVPKTDPGWTPVFSKIGGLITETGGVLSHGAVVSREYGIPAVTNVVNACRILETGQLVQINGYTGKVTIIEK
jgi:pyruvate,water dikinase